ncbi:MAG TPA: phosphoribosylformylglycinamidine synthase subunit PurS [Candidatus Cloacimonadota bacterium]|nr:phosphoribosylformylglycinamidine synthase subunit PurS [Candidatus Cloacimonadota bacterium]
MLKAKIFVRLKASVLDPQGKAVTQSLHQLGYQDVIDTRVSKYIELVLNETDPEKAQAEIDGICDKLLANPNTETYDFSLEQVEN